VCLNNHPIRLRFGDLVGIILGDLSLDDSKKTRYKDND